MAEFRNGPTTSTINMTYQHPNNTVRDPKIASLDVVLRTLLSRSWTNIASTPTIR